MEQLLAFFKKNVPQTDKKALEILESTGKELPQAQLEGINRKENCVSIRVVDKFLFMIPHMLTQYPISQTTDAPTKLLMQLNSKGFCLENFETIMVHNSSTTPYWEYIRRNAQFIKCITG
jgi:hypothetical protein